MDSEKMKYRKTEEKKIAPISKLNRLFLYAKTNQDFARNNFFSHTFPKSPFFIISLYAIYILVYIYIGIYIYGHGGRRVVPTKKKR